MPKTKTIPKEKNINKWHHCYIYSAGSSPAWGMCITAHLIFFFFPGLDTVTSSVPYIFVLDFRFFKIEINYISIFWSHVIIDFQPPLSTVIIWTPNELFLFVKLVNFHILNTNELFLFAKLVNFHYFHLARLPSTLSYFI